MGSSSLSVQLSTAKTPADVRKAFDELRDRDRVEYGNDPYSGSWNTVGDLKILDRVFDSRDEGMDYALQNTDKREAMAVRVKTFKEGKRIKDIKVGINDLQNQLARMRYSSQQPVDETEYKRIQREIKKLQKRWEKLEASARARSKDTSWIIAGWCAE